MRQLFVLVMLAFNSSIVQGQTTASLVCTGVNAAGAKETVDIEFSETEGWASDIGAILKVTGGVTANEIRTFSYIVNRQTGEIVNRRASNPKESFKGTCEKKARKF